VAFGITRQRKQIAGRHPRSDRSGGLCTGQAQAIERIVCRCRELLAQRTIADHHEFGVRLRSAQRTHRGHQLAQAFFGDQASDIENEPGIRRHVEKRTRLRTILQVERGRIAALG
jgi:hypothetical protein